MSTSRFRLDHPALKRAASVREVSDFLGVSKRHVEEQICAGRIQATKLPRKRTLRILPAALIRYLEVNARIPEAGQPCDLIAMKILIQAHLSAKPKAIVI